MGMVNRITKMFSAPKNPMEVTAKSWTTVTAQGSGHFSATVNEKEYVKQLHTNSKLHPVMKIITDFEGAEYGLYKEKNNRRGKFYEGEHPIYYWMNNVDPMTEMDAQKSLGVCMANYLMVGESILLLEKKADINESYFVAIPKEQILKRPLDFNVAGQYEIMVYGKKRIINKGTDIFAVFKNPQYVDITTSIGVMNSIAEEAGLAKDMMAFERNSIQSGGAPAYVYMMDGAPPEAVDYVQAKLDAKTTGPTNAKKSLVFSEKVDIKAVQNSMLEMDYINSKKENATEIREATHIPAEVLGNLKNSNKATALVAGQIYGRQVLLPLFSHMARVITREFVKRPEIKKSYRNLRFVFENLVPEDMDLTLQFVKEGFVNGTITRNEYRRAIGHATQFDLPELDDRVGADLIQPLATSIVDSETGEVYNPNATDETKSRKIKQKTHKVKEIDVNEISDDEVLVTLVDDDVGGNDE